MPKGKYLVRKEGEILKSGDGYPEIMFFVFMVVYFIEFVLSFDSDPSNSIVVPRVVNT